MSTSLRRAGLTAISSAVLLAVASGVSAAGVPTVPAVVRPAPSGTPDNGCANPILATDLAGWSTTGGDVGDRVPTTTHIVADRELAVRPTAARTLVHGPERAVPGAGQWDLTYDLRTASTAAARVEATWYDAAGVDLGRARGTWITVQGGERYTRVGDRFLAPDGATRAEIAVAVDQAAPTPFALTMCSYRPVEAPIVPAVVGTADPTPPTLAPVTTTPSTNPAPVDPTPSDPTPGNPPPTDPAPVDPTPVDPAPVDPAPVDPVPVDPAPVDPVPVDPAPVDPAPVNPAPVDPAPVNPAPVDPVPVDPAPVRPVPVDPAPVSPEPVDPAPVDPAPVGPVAPEPVLPEPVGPVPVKPVPLTAAERFGWGTPLPASDEFDVDGAPDPTKWVQAGECWPGHTGNGRRCATRTTVEDGVLVETGLANGDTGWLASRHGTRYGRWEMRVRSIQTGSGASPYHPVLIVWPDSENWPADGEYDFLENSTPGAACAEAWLHYPHPNLPVEQEFARETDCGAPLSEWHTVAFEWTPDHVRGFIDGEQWFSFSGGAGPGGRAPVQAMPSGHLTIQLDNFDDAGRGNAPARLEVDWVRIYGV